MRATQNGLDLLRRIAAHGVWGAVRLTLADVGASRGIDRRWAALGDRLAAVGFDPLVAEVERLNMAETRPHVHYEAAFVGCRDYDRFFPPQQRDDEIATKYNQPYVRSSAAAAHRIRRQDYVRERFNAGAGVRYTDRFVTLDEYFASSPLKPNFLKIDTDGSDFQVLLGASSVLASPDLLGIQVEAQFHGAVHEYANVFANIDRHLRERGFSLFDLETVRYSRAALPAPFAIGVLAQTVSGQVHWGEAVYFRDLAHPSYRRMFAVDATPERLLQLACLFVLYGLDDCAVEILTSSLVLAELPGRERLIDALTPREFGDPDYRAYIRRFNADPTAWLPRRAVLPPSRALQGEPIDTLGSAPARSVVPGRTDSHMSGAAAQAPIDSSERLQATVREMRERIIGLKKVQRKLRRLLQERDEKIRRMREERLQTKAGIR